VTEAVLAMRSEIARQLADDQYNTDELRHCKTAPAWIRNWSGPFWIEVAAAIKAYFEAETGARLPLVGQRVRLARDVERFDSFIAAAGLTGTVTESDAEHGAVVYVQMDEHLPGAEPWDNCIQWAEDYVADLPGDLELIGVTPDEVSIDDGETWIPAFVRPDRWNGFANPDFSKAQIPGLVEHWNNHNRKCGLAENQGTWLQWDGSTLEMTDYEYDERGPMLPSENGLWYFGGGFTWWAKSD
jgi:hypothetical protein